MAVGEIANAKVCNYLRAHRGAPETSLPTSSSQRLFGFLPSLSFITAGQPAAGGRAGGEPQRRSHRRFHRGPGGELAPAACSRPVTSLSQTFILGSLSIYGRALHFLLACRGYPVSASFLLRVCV